jgi:hypothetical protein
VFASVFLPCHPTFRKLLHHFDEPLAVVFKEVIRHGENTT